MNMTKSKLAVALLLGFGLAADARADLVTDVRDAVARAVPRQTEPARRSGAPLIPSVPDGGTTLALMGGALVLLEGVRRRIAR